MANMLSAVFGIRCLIGRDLGLSPKTVDNHIQSIYAKLGVKTRGGATLFALERGLLHPGTPNAQPEAKI